MKGKISEQPGIFRVNWFRKGADGKFLWPGFGQNMRVLQWIVNRVKGRVPADETIFGYVPRYEDINWNGLVYDEATFNELMTIDPGTGRRELEDQAKLFNRIGERLPPKMEEIRQELLEQLQS